MCPDPEDRERREHFLERYARPRADAARQVERAVLGREVGVNGYTTVEQAGRLHDALALSAEARLLDLGAGRGWPGSYLVAASGCRVVSSDIPVNALRAARGYFTRAGIHGRAVAVSADGVALPFRSRAFDAVVHADVFC